MLPDSILIFTDGSSRGNPGPGGFGAIVVMPERIVELGGGEKMTTNNRMELSAAIAALEFCSSLQLKSFNIQLFSDSSYVINGITKWVFGWQKNGWKNSQKEDVLNRDLWEVLIAATSGKKIEWKHVRGHAGHDANERCDEIATGFADGLPPKLYDGPRNSYAFSVATDQISSEKGTAIYLSLVGGKIERHKTWAECEARVKGQPAVKFKKVFGEIEAERVIKSWAA